MLLTSLFSSISNDDLEQFQTDALKGIPCQSQSVEFVTGQCNSKSYKCFGHGSRPGMIYSAKRRVT